MFLADASSGASDDTAVTGAIFLRGPSPTEGHVTPGEEKPGCGEAHRLELEETVVFFFIYRGKR